MLSTSVLILSFKKGPNILRRIVISYEKNSSFGITPLDLSTLVNIVD